MFSENNQIITRQDIFELEKNIQNIITTSTESLDFAHCLCDSLEEHTEELQNSIEEYNSQYKGFIGACKIGGFASGDLNEPENQNFLDLLFLGITQTIIERMTQTTQNFYLIYDNDENGTGYQILFSKICFWCSEKPEWNSRIIIKLVIKEGAKENILPGVSTLPINYITVSTKIQSTFDPNNWAAIGNYGIDEIVKLMKNTPGGLKLNGVMCCYLGGASTIYGDSPIGEYLYCRQNHPYIRVIASKTKRKKISQDGTVQIQDYSSFGLTSNHFDEFEISSQFT